MSYTPPRKDMQFVLHELVGLGAVSSLPGCEEVTPDLVDAILDEAGKLASDVLAPINWSGDKQGAKWHNGAVTTPDGFKQAYRQFVEGGWNQLRCEPEYGGQGLPALVSTPVEEMFGSANMAFSLCPLLTQGAIEAIQLCATPELKQRFLHKMIAGDWTGTMNLTEPQAGSDLAALRSRAIPEGDHYRISGQKIYITYGEHDMADNIIHLVLARTPDAPEGVKGISLFIVPKFLVKDDGSLGERNDVHCVSIEHKLGIHGSPTAVLAFGDRGGAIGYLIGEENRGLQYMFIMMNAARFAVGLEGLSIGERAYQKALSYAKERVQGTDIAKKGAARVTIINHPDVRRMLMSMKSQTEAMRALFYSTAALFDIAKHHPDAEQRKRHLMLGELLIPIVKAWSTELGIEIASTGIQIHGGMGFIEETGAAQHMRDARITTIYEGTTGIQALDLIGRKLGRDGGVTLRALLGTVGECAKEINAIDDANCKAIAYALGGGVKALGEASQWVGENFMKDPRLPAAGAVPYLMCAGYVLGGWQMARAAIVARNKLAAGTGDAEFYQAKLGTARFYADHILPKARALSHEVINGAESVLALQEAQF
jgi:3-(methylthio)propanoyl-CoA dehydrogenase